MQFLKNSWIVDLLEMCHRFHGTSLMVQWLRLCAPNAGGPDLIPGQGMRSHMPQLWVSMLQSSQISKRNKYFWKYVTTFCSWVFWSSSYTLLLLAKKTPMLSLFLCMVLESTLVSFFYKWLTNFPSTTC